MSEWLSQFQFPGIPSFLFVFFVVVVGLIALMFVLVFLRILWSIIRLIFGSRSRRYSLDNSGGNSAWRASMGNLMHPNSPLNPNNPNSWTNMNSPNNPFGWTNPNSPNNPNGSTNMNSPNNPFGWRHPASPNNPHNRMHKPMHTPMHRPMHKR
jgi:hypothetical protein